MRHITFLEMGELAEQHLMHIEDVFSKMRAFLGFSDWLCEWLEQELPPETAIPTREQAVAYLGTFPTDVQYRMRARAMRIADKFKQNEPLLQATIWDGLIILSCFDFDETRIKLYANTPQPRRVLVEQYQGAE
jgi:hypothetical protein